MFTHLRTCTVAALLLAALCTEPGRASAGEPAREGFTNSVGMRFASLPAGRFEMGCSGKGEDFGKDETRRTVAISQGFGLAVVPVTNAELSPVRPQTPQRRIRGHDLDGDTQPAVRVSWEDAVKYCEWLTAQPKERHGPEVPPAHRGRVGIRLPRRNGDRLLVGRRLSARGVQLRRPADGRAGARFGRPHRPTTNSRRRSPVGSFPANPWGLHDMHGNVWQWCSNRYRHDYQDDRATDPAGPGFGSTRVLRGGGWFGRAGMCRSSASGFQIRTNAGPTSVSDWFACGNRAAGRPQPGNSAAGAPGQKRCRRSRSTSNLRASTTSPAARRLVSAGITTRQLNSSALSSSTAFCE